MADTSTCDYCGFPLVQEHGEVEGLIGFHPVTPVYCANGCDAWDKWWEREEDNEGER